MKYSTYNIIQYLWLMNMNQCKVCKIQERITFCGIPFYTRGKNEKTGEERKTLLGGLWHERRLGKSKKVCVCGLQVYSRNRRRKKVLGIILKRYDYEGRWLRELAQKVGEEYDDVYLLRHNMGDVCGAHLHGGASAGTRVKETARSSSREKV